MLNCCFCEFWKPIGDDRIAATNGYCRFNAPAAILPHQLSRKDLSERDKFELGERAGRLSAYSSDHKFTMELRAEKTSQNQTLNSDQSHCI